MNVYIDESGFTGEDLINKDQPVLALASTALTEDLAKYFKNYCFLRCQAAELKHSSLVKRTRGQDMILEFIKGLKTADCATYIVHKEFCLLTKLVDLWIEAAMHKTGVDFYKDGVNIAFSNMAFFCLRTFESKQFLTKHLRRFQKMMRERTVKRYRDFWKGMYVDSQSCRKQTAKILDYFLLSERILGGPTHLARLPEKSIDITLTCALQLAKEWSARKTDALEFFHDTSSPMAREKWLWDAIVSPTMPTASVGFAHRMTKFPLGVTTTTFPNSKSNDQLQLADILAGATAEWARGKLGRSQHKKYCAALEKAGIAKTLCGGIWPEPKVERLQPIPGEKPVDPFLFFGHIISKSPRGR